MYQVLFSPSLSGERCAVNTVMDPLAGVYVSAYMCEGILKTHKKAEMNFQLLY